MSHKIEIFENINNISKVMKESSLAICSGGTTCWELIFTDTNACSKISK